MRNKNVVSVLGFIILVAIILLIIISFSKMQRNRCIDNGGTPIDNFYGLFDKCMYQNK